MSGRRGQSWTRFQSLRWQPAVRGGTRPASDADGLPPVLRDLLTGRIEQLPADARALVAAASVLGVSSDHRLLARVVDLDADALDSALVGAVRDGVLIADGGSGVVRFRHALLQEAAHSALFPAERVQLHHRAA